MEKLIKRILVSQPQPLSEHNPYAEMEKLFDVHFDFKQLIRIIGMDVNEFRRLRIMPQDYPFIIFNSRHGVDNYFRICNEMKFKVPSSQKYFCLSETIAKYLQKYVQYRKRNVYIAENNRWESLFPTMKNFALKNNFLMVVSDIHSAEKNVTFEQENIHIVNAPMYRTVPIDWPQDLPFDYDMIVLFTPSGVRSLQQNFPNWQQGDTIVACMGENTIKALENWNIHIDIKAPTADCPSITQAIKDYLEKHLS